MNACTAIVGINWGDEGKGRMVDLMTEAYDVVIRYQGGANAGHTVINQFGEFEIHALPSGVFRKEVVNVIGNGVALDPSTRRRRSWPVNCSIRIISTATWKPCGNGRTWC